MCHPGDAASSIQCNPDDVNAPDQILQVRVCHEKRLGRCKQPALLGWRYRLFCLNQPAAPNLDLNKDEIVTTQHDQVEFPGPTSPLLRYAGVARCFELPARVVFSGVTQILARRSHFDERPHEATGEKHWRWWTLGPCSASRALCSGEQ